ncbi:MAG TPA: D-2-hydroxyacid dehydrogenase [Vicinamibacteria bacterium]|nr:D-2-hydroxyacid dehydrogenase [Vicinamibacteria bacterium]
MADPDATASLTCWVLARPDDPGLRVLDPPPPGVRFVVGHHPEAFDEADAPAALLDCWAGPQLLAASLAKAPRLRWLHSRSAGLDRVLLPQVVAHPALVTSGSGPFSAALAEFVAAALFFFAKDLRRLVEDQHARAWRPAEMRMLAGQTLGVVGYGDIGRAVAARLRPFGMRVLALRRRVELSAADPLVDELVPPGRLPELMARADAVVVATPLTADTRGLVGASAIAAMKPTSVLVNVGRGPVVDEAALVSALEERRIRGAALDVFEHEPLPETHPFWRMDNVLVSPHCADHVPGWVEAAMRLFLDNLERFRRSQPLLNVADKQRGY